MKSKIAKKTTALLTAVMLLGSTPTLVLAQDTAAVSVTEEAQSALVHFINYDDPTKTSSVATFLANPKVYTKDGKSFFRVDVQQVYSVTLTVAGKEGVKVAEYDT